MQSTTSISKWERATKHVESDVRTGKYINAETALIFVGPPRLADLGGIGKNITSSGDVRDQINKGLGANDALYPVGMVEAFSMQQFQNVQKMFEIGSRRSYQAGGRVQVSGSIGRVMFNGASLLRVLYAYYPGVIAMANGQLLSSSNQDSVSGAMLKDDASKAAYPSVFFEPGAFTATDQDSTKRHSFFINLMSELFSHPFGMGVLFRDNANLNYGAFYCEDCMVTTHSLAISSSSTLITEAVNFQCDAAVPMEFSTDTAGGALSVAGLGAAESAG